MEFIFHFDYQKRAPAGGNRRWREGFGASQKCGKTVSRGAGIECPAFGYSRNSHAKRVARWAANQLSLR